MAGLDDLEIEGLDEIADLELLDDDDLLTDDSDGEEVGKEPEPEKPKKRGRPRKTQATEEQPGVSEPEKEQPKKRRGRPKGSKNKPKEPAETQVDPTDPVFIFRAALDNRIKDVKKAGGDVDQLEWVKALVDLIL